MKAKVFYHSADPDGWCCGAITLQALERDEYEVELAPINYDKAGEVPLVAADVDEVYILDFTFRPEVMQQLHARFGHSLIWIDHHKRAIEETEAALGVKVYGIRDSTIAACEQVWTYFTTDEMPRAIKLVGDYDVWKFQYGDDTRLFNAGVCAQDNIGDASDPIWSKLFIDESFIIQDTIDDGKLIMRMKTQFAELLLKGSKTIDWMGYQTIVVNVSPMSFLVSHIAEVARSDPDLYPGEVFLAWAMWQDEKGQSQIGFSLRSLTDEVDVSALASEHGGGGHKAAAGFGINDFNIPYLEQ